MGLAWQGVERGLNARALHTIHSSKISLPFLPLYGCARPRWAISNATEGFFAMIIAYVFLFVILILFWIQWHDTDGIFMPCLFSVASPMLLVCPGLLTFSVILIFSPRHSLWIVHCHSACGSVDLITCCALVGSGASEVVAEEKLSWLNLIWASWCWKFPGLSRSAAPPVFTAA